MKTKVKRELIAAIAAVIVAFFGGGAINNQITIHLEDGERVVVKPEDYNRLLVESTEYKNENETLSDKNKTLEKEISDLKEENRKLKEQANNSSTAISTSSNTDDDSSENIADSVELMTVCSPYETPDVDYDAENSFNMGGDTYGRGFVCQSYWGGYLLFNLQGKYSTMKFKLGHIDNTQMHDCKIEVYLDGKYHKTIEQSADELVSDVKINLKNARQLKLNVTTGSGEYGFADIMLYK